ncbi:MAG TPA: hypothetical protein VGG39_05175 [Polyangiaceae bacterium]|jgi:hypothetical protein
MVFGGGSVTPYGVSAAADGTVRTVGSLRGIATLGPVTLNSAGGLDVLVAKLDSAGEILWARSYGDPQDQSASASAVDAEGNVVVVGSFSGTLDFTQNQPVLQSLPVAGTVASGAAVGGPGTSPLRARGSSDAFVAKLDANGSLQWALQFGASRATVSATAIALGPQGDMAITGTYEGSLGNGTTTSAGGRDAFVLKLDSTGATQWVRTFGGAGMDSGTSAATNDRGEVLVTGSYEGAIDMGTGQLPEFGMEDVFVAKLGAGGSTVWAEGFGGNLNDDAVSVAFDASGDAVTLGDYAGTVDLGTGSLASCCPPAGPEGLDIFVAKYDSEGRALWAHNYGSMDPWDKGDGLVVDPSGTIYIAGHVRAGFPFGACGVTPNNAIGGDAFIGWLTADGDAVCARTYGYGATTQIHSFAKHPTNGLVMVGHFVGGVDFGQGATVASQDSGFIAREQPDSPALQ